MRRNQAAVVSFDLDRQYLALSLGSTFRLSNIAVTEGTVPSFYIDAGESPIEIGQPDNSNTISYTIETEGTYEIKYKLEGDENYYSTGKKIIAFSQNLADVLDFRQPPNCCYNGEGKTHTIYIKKKEGSAIDFDLSRIKASNIKISDDGTKVLNAYDLTQNEIHFTITENDLKGFDQGIYPLVIVEGNDYLQPLFTSIVQFSHLAIESSYSLDAFTLNMACIYQNLKIQTKDEESTLVALTCEYITDTKTNQTLCSLPQTLHFCFITALSSVGFM